MDSIDGRVGANALTFRRLARWRQCLETDADGCSMKWRQWKLKGMQSKHQLWRKGQSEKSRYSLHWKWDQVGAPCTLQFKWFRRDWTLPSQKLLRAQFTLGRVEWPLAIRPYANWKWQTTGVYLLPGNITAGGRLCSKYCQYYIGDAGDHSPNRWIACVCFGRHASRCEKHCKRSPSEWLEREWVHLAHGNSTG